MSRAWAYLKAYAMICRFEYIPGELPAILMVFFLGLNSLLDIFTPLVMESLGVFVLLYFSGFIINAYTDRETDKRYDTFKSDIPAAVETIGIAGIRNIMMAHVALSVLITAHISYMMADVVPLALVLVGTFFGLGYSIRPFRFKERGVWHAIALGSSAFFLPFIFMLYVMLGNMPLYMLILIFGFSLIHYGMEFGNQAIDYIEDVKEGIMTPPVRWGMTRSLSVALALFVVGVSLELPIIYMMTQERVDASALLPSMTPLALFAAFVAILFAGYYIPLNGLFKMHRLSARNRIEDVMPRFKDLCKYSRWQASGVLGLMVVTGILFFGNIVAPATVEMEHASLVTSDGVPYFAQPLKTDYGLLGGKAVVNVSYVIGVSEGHFLPDCLGLRVESICMDEVVDREIVWYSYGLEEGYKWNTTVQLSVHDVDDTGVRASILTRETTEDEALEVSVRTIQSPNEVYIYSASVEQFQTGIGQRDRVANVTVLVYNDHGQKDSGSLQLTVTCFRSGGIEYSASDVILDYAMIGKGTWEPTIEIDIPDVDPGDLYYHIDLLSQESQQPIDQTTIE